MTVVRNFLVAVVFVGFVPAAVAQDCKAVSWSRQIIFGASPEAKQKAVSLLFEIAKKKGLGATPAAPGLDELIGRPVVYFSFGRNPKDMLLTVTDVLKPTELLVRAYYEPTLPGIIEAVAKELIQSATAVEGVRVIEDRTCSRPT